MNSARKNRRPLIFNLDCLQFEKQMRIRSYLALMAVSILCPVLLAGAMAVDKIRREERESALQNLKETARSVSLVVDREIQG